MADSGIVATQEYGEKIIRHPQTMRRRLRRGPSYLHDIEDEIDEYRTRDAEEALDGAHGQPGPQQGARRDQVEGKLEHYLETRTHQDLARQTQKHRFASMEPHSARKPRAESSMIRTGRWAEPSSHLQTGLPEPKGLARTASTSRVTLAVTSHGGPSLDAEQDAPAEEHVLPQELLGYRDPAAALCRIGLSALRRLESKGRVPKAMRVVRQTDAGQSLPQHSTNCLHGLVKLMLAVVGHEAPFDDFDQLIEDGGLSEALQLATGLLNATTYSRKLWTMVTEIVGSARTQSTQDVILSSLLTMHDKNPTVTTSLCCWLYGKLLQADPERYSLTRKQAEIWRFLKLQPPLRSQDRRISTCEAWAVDEVDVLRHLPSATLREVFLTASCTTLRPGQRVLRVGEIHGTIAIVFAGSLNAMVVGLDAHERAKMTAAQVISKIGSRHSKQHLAVIKSQADAAVNEDSANTWMRKWQESLAKDFVQRWADKTRLNKARQKSKEKVPLALGPGTAIGQSAAISNAKRAIALESPNHKIATKARKLVPKRLGTAIIAECTTMVIEIEEPRHVVAIERAIQVDHTWKFEALYTFEGLQGCSCDALQNLVRRVSREVVREGEKLFSVGEPATELFFVVSGALEINVPRSDGTINRIAVVGPGATFGSFPEMIATRHATVTATADSVVLSVHVYNFHDSMAHQRTDVVISDYGSPDRFQVLRTAVHKFKSTGVGVDNLPARPRPPVHSSQHHQHARPSTSGHSARDHRGHPRDQQDRYSAEGRSSDMAQSARLPSTLSSLSAEGTASLSASKAHRNHTVPAHRQNQIYVPAGNKGARGVAKAMGASTRRTGGGMLPPVPTSTL